MRILKMALGLCLLVLFANCFKDTCNSQGETFQAIELDDVQLDATGQLVVSFYTEALNVLPERYFEDGTISGTYQNIDVDGPEELESYVLKKEGFKITLKPEALPLDGETSPLKLAFEFRDRRGYIDCKHSGMSDSYHVLLEMEMLNKGVDGFDLSSFEWSQYTAKGAL